LESTAFGTLPSALKRIGGMATMPTRLESCRIAMPSILAQVDRLYLYLDGYPSVPDEFAREPKIVPLLPGDGETSLRGAGKLVGLRAFGEPCLYFCFDDDIVYPPNYVEHMAAALRRHHYRAIVGLHASVYKVPVRSYVRDRQVLHFSAASHFDYVVDELGTGTAALHSSCIRIAPRRWGHHNMCDLMLMIESIRQGVPRISIRRPDRFLLPIEQSQDDSLYRRTLVDDSIQSRLLRATFERYPDRWCMSD
jgi:hypothetical protein